MPVVSVWVRGKHWATWESDKAQHLASKTCLGHIRSTIRTLREWHDGLQKPQKRAQ